MDAARALIQARKRAGISQRELATRVGVPQSVVARLERGIVVPRVDTLDRLLGGCNEALESRPKLGRGIDRTQIRELLAQTPGERARLAVREVRNVSRALGAPGRKR